MNLRWDHLQKLHTSAPQQIPGTWKGYLEDPVEVLLLPQQHHFVLALLGLIPEVLLDNPRLFAEWLE